MASVAPHLPVFHHLLRLTSRFIARRWARRPGTLLVRWLFLRGLGLINLVAFTSLRRQVLGLYGARGISPIQQRLHDLRVLSPRQRYQAMPSLLWTGASDRALIRWCGVGQVGALLLLLGVAPRLMTRLLWAVYLSFVSVGGSFLRYQWDALLLESGLHAMLVAPAGVRPGLGRTAPSRPAVAALRWLAFRLHFESGLAKLQSGDPTWRSLTACDYHFATQPLPNRGAWTAHHLGRRARRAISAGVLVVETAVPLLAFAPPRWRRLGGGLLIGLQGSIAATGNYGFFNLLAADLALWLLDDEVLSRHLRIAPVSAAAPPGGRRTTDAAATALVALSGLLLAQRFTLGRDGPLVGVHLRLAPLHSINHYGLFAVMTTSRPEIIVEASDDGETWHPYELCYKPGALDRPPRQAAPHQPRLDWQLWFAALQPPPVWFAWFLRRLLEASPDVLALLERAPFGDRPPRFVRAVLYDYEMTDRETRRRSGQVWRRRYLGLYFPACSLPA